MEKEIRISVNIETGNSTEILLVESGININGKPVSLNDCVCWAGMFKEIRELFIIKGRELLQDTVNDIMNIK